MIRHHKTKFLSMCDNENQNEDSMEVIKKKMDLLVKENSEMKMLIEKLERGQVQLLERNAQMSLGLDETRQLLRTLVENLQVNRVVCNNNTPTVKPNKIQRISNGIGLANVQQSQQRFKPKVRPVMVKIDPTSQPQVIKIVPKNGQVSDIDDAHEPSDNWQQNMENRVVEGQKVLACLLCNYTTKYRTDMKNHIKAVHLKKVFSCEYCSFVSHWRKSVQGHVERIHKNAVLKEKQMSDQNVPRFLSAERNPNANMLSVPFFANLNEHVHVDLKEEME